MNYILSFFSKGKEGGKDSFTGIKDVDAEILLKLDNRSFIRTCSLNNYFMDLCEENDGLLFKRKLQLFYPDTIQYAIQYKDGSWKNYYASVIKTIALLHEEYKFNYTRENPFIQLDILSKWGGTPEFVVLEAARLEQISLIEYMFRKDPRLMQYFSRIN